MWTLLISCFFFSFLNMPTKFRTIRVTLSISNFPLLIGCLGFYNTTLLGEYYTLYWILKLKIKLILRLKKEETIKRWSQYSQFLKFSALLWLISKDLILNFEFSEYSMLISKLRTVHCTGTGYVHLPDNQ